MNCKRILLLLFFSSLLMACSFTRQQDLSYVNTTDLGQMENLCTKPLGQPTSSSYARQSNLRVRLLKDIALGLGAQGGLAYASEKMNGRMNHDRQYLDTIFNFNGMMLSHGVIPPVLEMGDRTLNLDDPNTIRVSDRTYKIVAQARFATTPPNWREYLLMAYDKPCLPDRTLLPRNETEQKIWRAAIRAGWEQGINQSYNIFQQNLARLKRDYRGMAIYRKLLQEKMISQPFVARTELGVTGNGTDMRINDQVLRIVELPQLQTNSKGWKAVVVHDNG